MPTCGQHLVKAVGTMSARTNRIEDRIIPRQATPSPPDWQLGLESKETRTALSDFARSRFTHGGGDNVVNMGSLDRLYGAHAKSAANDRIKEASSNDDRLSLSANKTPEQVDHAQKRKLDMRWIGVDARQGKGWSNEAVNEWGKFFDHSLAKPNANPASVLSDLSKQARVYGTNPDGSPKVDITVRMDAHGDRHYYAVLSKNRGDHERSIAASKKGKEARNVIEVGVVEFNGDTSTMG